MKILITGGTGFIGRKFITNRLKVGDEIICLSRDPEKVDRLFDGQVKQIRQFAELGNTSVDAVVNLAGEPIADKRWTESRKALLRSSRIDLTAELVNWISLQGQKPKVLISGSAIGYYGSHESDLRLGEASEAQSGFTHNLCKDWEEEALKAELDGVRVCLIRTGIVLGDGGALSKMLLPFKLGLGGPIGNGEQWMSWIHIDDEVEIIEMLLTHEHLSGAFNLTAPEALINREFTRIFASVLSRPACLPMPPFVAKLMLGEGAELLLRGQRVYPEKLLEVGYKFKHESLQSAMASLFSK